VDFAYRIKAGCCWCFGACKHWSGLWPIIHLAVAPGSYCQPPPEPPYASFLQSPAAASEPPEATPTLGTDGFGHTQAIWRAQDGNLVASTFDGVSFATPVTLTTVMEARSPAIAFFAPDRAVAVWSQSNLSLAQWDTASLTEAVKSQHIAAATWDGVTWSAPVSLTLASTGESDVALAACPSTNSACPAGGVVTAVWVKDEVGELAQRQFRLYYATYSGQTGTWSAPQAVDPANTSATDNQPQVVYNGSYPLVAWVRDADRDLTTLDDHRVATRLLDGSSPAIVPTGIPTSVMEISLAMSEAGPRMAFTRAEHGGGLLDNRHYLWIAAESAGTWYSYDLWDSHGRDIRAEKPQLLLDDQGRRLIAFRSLGFGPMPDGTYQSFREDPVGAVTGSGELAVVDVSGLVARDPRYLTNDGAVYWENSAIFDPATNSVIALATQGTPVASGLSSYARQMPSGAKIQSVADGEPVIFAIASQMPDFGVAALIPSSRYPQPGETPTVDVQVRNNWIGWSGDVTHTLDVLLTWDGGPGVGAVAGLAQLLWLDAGEVFTFTWPLNDPPTGYDQPHTLVATINPYQTITESDGTNNSLSTVVGGLPAPTGVTAAADKGNPRVFLQWTMPYSDTRIAGYHIYRAADSGTAIPAGSTFITGFVDMTAQVNHTYQYIVTSYADNGIESEPSNAVSVTLGRHVYLPLILRSGL
jgi:hypothetical protein